MVSWAAAAGPLCGFPTHTVPDSGTIISETLLHIQTAHEANNWSKLLADPLLWGQGHSYWPFLVASHSAGAVRISPLFCAGAAQKLGGSLHAETAPDEGAEGGGLALDVSHGCVPRRAVPAAVTSLLPVLAPVPLAVPHLCPLTQLSEKPPAFRGAQPRPFLAPGPPNHQAYPPHRQDLVVSTVPLSGGHSPNELEINSTDPFPDSFVHLGLIEDRKKKS